MVDDIPYDELINLDYTLAEYIYPRLVAFKENATGYPSELSEQEYERVLGEMIEAFRLILEDEPVAHRSEITRGLELFGRYFRSLWL